MDTNRKRPPRLVHVFQSIRDPLYFVTMVTWQRQPLLANPVVLEAFVERTTRQADIGIAVGRFVIMPDHIHLFVGISPGQTLGETVKHIKQSITKALRHTKPDLRVWQPGFFDHLLRNGESYRAKWSYVQDNPVRARVCTDANEWPYQGEIVRIERT